MDQNLYQVELLQSCAKSIENFVFRPKMAISQRAGLKEGGLPLPLAFLIFDSYDMKSLWFKFGHGIFAGFKMARL